jgi:hypothetical protein
MATVKIIIPEIIGTPDCVATTDGQKVHDEIAANLRSGNTVQISFLGAKSIITAFLNAAIGQLYGDFKEDEIAGKLFLVDAKSDDIEKVRRVVAGAKTYFKDKKKFEAAQREAMETEENE